MKKIKSALISVFYKDGLDSIVKTLNELGVIIYSTGGTQKFIESLGVNCVAVESLTGYPSILGGRVKTLHPSVFGAILGRRDQASDVAEMAEYQIPEIDLVIVDLYPFEETVDKFVKAGTPLDSEEARAAIIEKIDVGGPSMLRAAAKNHHDVAVISSKADYASLEKILIEQKGETSLEQRWQFAAKAFHTCSGYDIAISNYFAGTSHMSPFSAWTHVLRYGENPHQKGYFSGDLAKNFRQLHGKELSYNNLVDVDAAMQLMSEFSETTFAIIKHTNVCGIASRNSVVESWHAALEGDPESAFGGVLICNGEIDSATAQAINEIFFEVLIAPAFTNEATDVLTTRKNRVLLELNKESLNKNTMQSRSLLNGILSQQNDEGNFENWDEAGGRQSTEAEKQDLIFANLACKHLKSNAIAIVKNKQLIGKGCGQTSRIDSLRQAIAKSKQFNFDLNGAVLSSDAFFPFDDCVKLSHEAGIQAFIQPGGSIRDKDSINYCKENNLVMVITGLRHFRH